MSAKRLRLYHKLQLAAHRAQKAADAAVLAAADVTTAQAAVLAVVKRSAPITQRGVASQLGLSEAAVATMTARLLAQRLLVRKAAPEDARAWRLELSADGAAALDRVEPAFRRINRLLEQAVSDDLEGFATALEHIGAQFSAQLKKQRPSAKRAID